MTYPTPPKMLGRVDDLDDETVYLRLWIAGDEYNAEVKRSDFGPDADKLKVGHLVSRPHRRDARWGLAPIRPVPEAKARRRRIQAEAWVKKIRKLMDEG